MSEDFESNKNYETVGDDDVLLFNESTFMVRRLKELVASNFRDMLQPPAYDKSMLFWIKHLRISEGTERIITGGELKWNSPQEGIDCQVLKIGSKGWQKGKLKIEVNKNIKSEETEASIKFCADEPPEQKSPLDDIRQSEEYKKLSDNN